MTHSPDALTVGLCLLVSITDSLCDCVENDDVAMLSSLIDEREELLKRQSKLTEEWKKSDADGGDQAVQMKSLLESLRQADEKLILRLETKKNELSKKLQQAQNSKLLLAYSK